jgi:hypothetical protein
MISKPETVALNIDHSAMMQQAIKHGRGNYRITKELLPFAETFI